MNHLTNRAHKLLAAAALIVPLLLFLTVAWVDRTVVLRDAERDTEEKVDLFEQQARSVIESYELIAERVDEHIDGMSWDRIAGSREVHLYLKKLADRYGQAEVVSLIDPSGVLRNSSLSFPAPSLSVTDRDYFAALRDGDKGTFIGHLVKGRILPGVHFNVVRRRAAPEGEFDGLIVVAAQQAYFARFWQTSLANRRAVAGLVRADGMILAREPPLPAGTIALPPNATLRRAIEGKGHGTFRAVSASDGVDRLYAFRKVGAYDAFVVYGIDVEAALAEWRTDLVEYGSFFGLAAAALFLMALAALRRAQSEQAALSQWRRTAQELTEEAERRVSAEDQLRQAQKMEALGQLTGGIAHDFRNLLNVVIGNLELLRVRPDDPKRQERIANALQAAARGEKAIQSLLAFARRQPLTIETAALAGVLRDMEPMLRQAVGSAVRLAISVDPDAWPVLVDMTQLELALLNLAVNARDAMPKGGSLTVAARNVTLAGEPHGLVGDFVALSVRDSGSGIEPAVLPRIFEPFFTTKGLGKGSGLGLAQVYGFALQCDGGVAVDSEPGSGTVFTLYLPRAAAPG